MCPWLGNLRKMKRRAHGGGQFVQNLTYITSRALQMHFLKCGLGMVEFVASKNDSANTKSKIEKPYLITSRIERRTRGGRTSPDSTPRPQGTRGMNV